MTDRRASQGRTSAGSSERTILVADDHPLFRDALKLAVGEAWPHAKVLEAARLSDAIDQARSDEPIDLILLDLRMPGAQGYSGVALIHAERPNTPIIVISSADVQEAAPRVRAFGARGFLSKTSDLATIQTTIRAVLDGDTDLDPLSAAEPEVDDMAEKIASLTPAQLNVLVGVLRGRLNKQIAYDLGISEGTVKGHMTGLMRKLGVRNRTQAVLASRALDLDEER